MTIFSFIKAKIPEKLQYQIQVPIFFAFTFDMFKYLTSSSPSSALYDNYVSISAFSQNAKAFQNPHYVIGLLAKTIKLFVQSLWMLGADCWLLDARLCIAMQSQLQMIEFIW